jgi:hypothetical protein
VRTCFYYSALSLPFAIVKVPLDQIVDSTLTSEHCCSVVLCGSRDLNVDDVLNDGGELETEVLNVGVGVGGVVNNGVHEYEWVGGVGEVEEVHAIGQ